MAANPLIEEQSSLEKALDRLEAYEEMLKLLAKGSTLVDTFTVLLKIVEEQVPGMVGLILLLDPDGQHLHIGAGPRLPKDYLDSIEGLVIGPMVGSCGTACYRKERVIVEDIAVDPRWQGLRSLALRHGLRACWSDPVFSPDGQVVGTFAMYYTQPKKPNAVEIRIVQMGAHLVSIAIEHHRSKQAVEEAYQSLEKRVEERTQELEQRRKVAEGLGDILKVINSNRPLKEVLDYLLGQACQLARSEAGVIYRFDLSQNLSWPEAVIGMPAGFQQLGPFPIVPWGPQRDILERKPSIIPDLLKQLASVQLERPNVDPRLKAWAKSISENFQAYLAVPLIVKEEVYGSISVMYRQPREFSQEEIELVNAFSNQAALAIENANLRAQAEENAVIAERNRLARDLHDAVTQSLFSASLLAEVTPGLMDRDPKEGRRRLEELRLLTRGALAEMRTLLLEMRPAALLEADLSELLRHLTTAFTGRTRVPVTLQASPGCTLPPDVKVAFYRIAQEAFNNISKHANANRVQVCLGCAGGQIKLSLQDDGQGFDTTQVQPEKLGLGIMRERAQASSVELMVRSRPGSGTTIEVTWKGENRES